MPFSENPRFSRTTPVSYLYLHGVADEKIVAAKPCDRARAITLRVFFARCSQCHEPSIWLNEQMIWPATVTAPVAHAEMPKDIAQDYEEARMVLAQSPRSSAALLRLCVEKLCVVLGEKGKDINADIGNLVAKSVCLF